MTPKEQREETLFAAALVKSPVERAAFLDGACHGDSALRVRPGAMPAAWTRRSRCRWKAGALLGIRDESAN